MTSRSLGNAVVLALFCLPAAAVTCSQGRGQLVKQVGNGYLAQVMPSSSTPGKCVAALLAPDGSTAFQIEDGEATLDPATGLDINNDGKPDVLFMTDPGPGQCCYLYSVVTPGETPALAHQMQTSSPLSFGDRDGDGKVEIWGRDNAFQGFDGLPADLSPSPMVFFRLNHDMLIPVPQLFWPEYEADINSTRAVLSNSRIQDFNPTNSSPESKENAEKKDKSPEEMAKLTETRALILQVVLDYLYGGRGKEAWDHLKDWWPMNDRPRIQQAILRARATGIMSEITRPVAKAAK